MVNQPGETIGSLKTLELRFDLEDRLIWKIRYSRVSNTTKIFQHPNSKGEEALQRKTTTFLVFYRRELNEPVGWYVTPEKLNLS